MTCGDKFNQNCPTGGSRVAPAEVGGRPQCNHPGCGKPLLGSGQCVAGHSQTACALQPAQEQALLALREQELTLLAEAVTAQWRAGHTVDPTLTSAPTLRRAIQRGNLEAEMLARATGVTTATPPVPRDLTQLTDAEFAAIRDRAVDWQYLTVAQGGMATKSKCEDWLMAQYNLTRTAAHQVMNHLEAHDLSFRIARDSVQWVNRERPAPTELPGFVLNPTPVPTSVSPSVTPPSAAEPSGPPPSHVADAFTVTAAEWTQLSGAEKLDRRAALRNSALLRTQGEAFLRAPQAASRNVNQEGFTLALKYLYMAVYWAQHAQDNPAVAAGRKLLYDVEQAWRQYTVPPATQEELYAAATDWLQQGTRDNQLGRPALPSFTQALAACSLANTPACRTLTGHIYTQMGHAALSPANPNQSMTAAQTLFTQALDTATQLHDALGAARALEGLSLVQTTTSRHDEAIATLGKASAAAWFANDTAYLAILDGKRAQLEQYLQQQRTPPPPSSIAAVRGHTLYYSDPDTGRRRRWGIVREETADGQVRVYNPNAPQNARYFTVSSTDLLQWLQQRAVYQKPPDGGWFGLPYPTETT